MAIKFLSGQTISGTLTVSGNVQGATFNGLAINTTGTNNVANQIVRTQANGYVNFGWINSISGNHTGSITRITASNDAYLRYVTPAQFRTGVTDGFYAPSSTVSGVTSVTAGNGLAGGTITTTGTLSTVHLPSFDTRNSNPDPEDYANLIRFDFKHNSTNGLSDGGTYNGQMTWRSYGSGSDMSGGFPVRLAYTANGNLYRQMGTSATSWGDWNKFALATGTSSQYIRGDGSVATFPTITGGTVTSVATGNGLTGGAITTTGTLTMSGSYTGDFSVTGFTTSTTGFGINYVSGGTVPMVILANATTYGIFYREASPDHIEFKHNNAVMQSFDGSGNVTMAGDLTVSGGDITLGGTGRIQGVDTVSASTDAANKAYVDAHPGSGGTVTSVATGNGLTGGTITTTGTLTMSGSYTGTFTATSLASNSFLNNAGSLLFSAGNTTTGASRSLNLRTTNATNDPSSSDDANSTGITWGQRSDSNPYYIIYPQLENWNSSGNYSKLTLAWHTGIKIGAASQYGGTRFYNNSPDITGASVIMNVGVGNDNIGVVNNLTVGSNLTFTGQNLRSTVGLFLQVDSGNVNAITIDNVGSTTFSGYTYFPNYLFHAGDTNTRIQFTTGTITLRGDTSIVLDGPTSTNANFTGTSATFSKSNGPVVQITKTGSAPGNNTALIVENTYANHSWGIVQEIRGGGISGTDRPGLLFSSPLTSQTWTTGYYQTFDTFAITSNRGYRNGGWGSWRMQVDSSGNTFAAGSSRAPIFYDSNNTAYYGDFASTSYSLNTAGSLKIIGAVGSDGDGASSVNQAVRVSMPNGASYSIDSGVTGAIKIRLPRRANNTMWSMKVRIYNYAVNQTSEYTIGNYSYSAGGYNSSASFQGAENMVGRQVRWGNDGTYDCVWIGETNSSWSYPVVSVMDFNGGFRNGTAANWTNNWDISLVTSFDTVATAYYPSTQVGNIGYATASFRAPIFYDSNNTAYYLDPAGSSILNVITTNGNVFNGNTTVSGNNYITFGPNTTWGSSLRVGGNGRTATGTEMASVVTTDGNLHLDAANSSNAIYLNYYAGTGGTLFGTGAGGYAAKVYSSGNAHFPIYYDYTNTAYYLDPASTSQLNVLNCAGTLTVTGAGGVVAPKFTDYNNGAFYLDPSSTGTSLNVAGDVVAYASSDIRFKNNITPITNALDKLSKIGGYTFEWNEISHKETGKKDIGVVAQEVEEILPEIVQTRSNGYKAVDYQKLTALLIESVKEQQVIINDLKTRIETLENN